jgi:hypothetical protein
MTQTCNYPGCKNETPEYRGAGPVPVRCAEHKKARTPAQLEANRQKVLARYHAKHSDNPAIDDEITQPDPINVELGHKRVELLYDPLPVEDGGFRPGARFDTDAIVTSGGNFGGATVQPWVYPGMVFQVHPYGKQPTKWRVNDDRRTELAS